MHLLSKKRVFLFNSGKVAYREKSDFYFAGG